MMIVIRKCAWCGRWLGFRLFMWKTPAGTETSGICEHCLKKQLEEVKAKKQAVRNQRKALNRMKRGINALLFRK